MALHLASLSKKTNMLTEQKERKTGHKSHEKHALPQGFKIQFCKYKNGMAVPNCVATLLVHLERTKGLIKKYLHK